MIIHSFFVLFSLTSSLEGKKERSFSFATTNVLVNLHSIIVVDEDVKVDESLYVFCVPTAKPKSAHRLCGDQGGEEHQERIGEENYLAS